MANCSSRKKGETEQEYRKRCGGYTYAFPIDLVQKKEPSEPPTPEEPTPEPPAPETDVSEAKHTKGNIYKGKLKIDGNPVPVEVELVGVDNRTRSYLVRVIDIDRKYLSYLPKTGIIPIPARLFDIPGGGWVKVNTRGQFEGKLNEAIKPQNIVNYYKGVCKAVGISPIPIKFGSVGRLGAATTYHTKTFEPLYITFDLGKVRDIETAVLHEITHQILLIKEKNPYNNCAKRPAKFVKIENSLIEKFTYSPLSKLLYEMSMVDLVDIDKFADKQLNPINVVLTGKHFFDRLQDPRNRQEITSAELIGFFKRLSKNKIKFLEFLKKYDEIVVKDNRTKINIPFMIKANDAIAKTIMRKSNFGTPSPEYTFETIKKVDGKWVVYPKSGGDRLGTHATYKDALKQLQAIEASKARNEDTFPGGLADKYSLDDLAKKHGVGVDEIKSQIAKGMKVEMEHTNDKKVAFEIAKDHIFEDPKYYDKLKTIENRIYELLKKKLREDWTNKYKKSIDCNNPKGFSQKAHCDGREARRRGEKTKSNPVK